MKNYTKKTKKISRLVVSECTFLGKIERRGRELFGEPSEMSLEMYEREQAGVFGYFFKKVPLSERPCGANIFLDKNKEFNNSNGGQQCLHNLET